MNKPEFTKKQEYWLCDVIGDWYLHWKDKMCSGDGTRNLGFAMDNLKEMICDKDVITINEFNFSLIQNILKLKEERESLIYDFDKVLPENRARYEEIQKELMKIENEK